MWCKTEMAIAALLISGISVALIDVTSAESAQKGKSARAPKWGDPGYYEGWVRRRTRAGGVGFKQSKKKKKAKK